MRAWLALAVVLSGLGPGAVVAGADAVALGAGDRLGERMFERPLRRVWAREGRSGANASAVPFDAERWLREWRRVRAEAELSPKKR